MTGGFEACWSGILGISRSFPSFLGLFQWIGLRENPETIVFTDGVPVDVQPIRGNSTTTLLANPYGVSH